MIDYLREHRCLPVLDSAETTLLGSGDHAGGRYREGYEEYDELLRRLG